MIQRLITALAMALALCIPTAGVSAQEDGTALYQAGALAYQAGDYAKAIKAYEALLDKGYISGEIYYNLGNAHFREGHIGESILAFRRAELTLPRDEDLSFNLDFLRGQVKDQLEQGDGDAQLGELIFWYDALSLSELTALTLILNLLAFGGLIVWRLRSKDAAMPLRIPLVFGLMLIALGTTIAKDWDQNRSPGAVVVYPEITARSGTDVKGIALFTLHEGAEVEALGEERSGWIQLRLPDGRRGWVESRFIGLVAQGAGESASP